ncbi:hypothetical protein RF11_14644 [Thelohanellus kitauei]|uniref:Uncharacterized protein n=1 Tax=Thelohanellus kitauei TaxID=669202 RepID=A0A0C2MI06_THEKT|nr:hypothetical protein RF11_14644 [Thelohanellus kitauei]
MTSSGDELNSFRVEEKVQEMGYSENIYHIYTKSKALEFDLQNKLHDIKRNLPKRMEIIEYYNHDIFITSWGIKMEESFLLFGNVKKSNYEKVLKQGMPIV